MFSLGIMDVVPETLFVLSRIECCKVCSICAPQCDRECACHYREVDGHTVYFVVGSQFAAVSLAGGILETGVWL